MDRERAARYARRLQTAWPGVGAWWRRRALVALAREGSPEALQVIAEAIATTPDDPLRAQGLAALGGVTNQAGIDAICAGWVSTRSPVLANLLRQKRWVANAPLDLAVLTGLLMGDGSPIEARGAEVVDPLVQACSDADPDIALAARRCLTRLQNAEAIDTLCARWAQSREPFLTQVIEQAGYVARAPAAVRVLSALQTHQEELLAGDDAAVVDPLLRACALQDRRLAERAAGALSRFTHPGAREAVCRLVLERDHPHALQAAMAGGYAPKDPQARALFFFLTEQWAQYEGLDFDQGLLGAAYGDADGKLRARIAEKARRTGRTEWISVISQGRQDRRLGELSDEEWATTFAVLVEGARWPDMWRLAQSARPDWGARLLHQLASVDWKPAGEDQLAGFSDLARLAGLCALAEVTEIPPAATPHRAIAPPPSLGRLVGTVREFQGHQGPVSCFAFCPDGRLFASGGNDTTVRLWDVTAGTLRQTLTGHTDWVSCLAMSPDGRLLAAGSRGRSVRLWTLPEGQSRGELAGHTDGVRCLGFAPDGRLLATGSDDKTARVWSGADGQPQATLEGHRDAISCLAISPDGQQLATGSYDQTVRLWNLPDGRLLTTLTGHKGLVNCLSFAANGQRLISGSKDRTLLLWDLRTPGKPIRLKGHKDDVISLAISPDGTLLASGSWDNTVRLWSLPEGRPVDLLGSTGTMDGHTGWVTCLAFAPDGRTLASGSLDRTALLWKIPEGKALTTLAEHQERISCLGFTPDGQALVTGSWDGSLRLWQSDLARLCRVPIAQTTLDHLSWTQEAVRDPYLTELERHWLELLTALMRWRRRHDIQLEERAPMAVGEFDIEIEG